MHAAAEVGKNDAPPRRFETVAGAAERTSVRPSFLYKLMRDKRLTRRKLGRKTLIDSAELDALIDAGATTNEE